MSTVAERIQWVLQEKGWSQRELARRSGLNDSQVGSLLARLSQRPDAVEIKTLRAIAQGAGVSERWLATGEGEAYDEFNDGPGTTADNVDAPAREEYRPLEPILGRLPEWPQLLEAARALDPKVPDWAWEKLATARAMLTAHPTPAMIRDLARVVMRHVSPPAPRPAKKETAPPKPKG